MKIIFVLFILYGKSKFIFHHFHFENSLLFSPFNLNTFFALNFHHHFIPAINREFGKYFSRSGSNENAICTNIPVFAFTIIVFFTNPEVERVLLIFFTFHKFRMYVYESFSSNSASYAYLMTCISFWLKHTIICIYVYINTHLSRTQYDTIRIDCTYLWQTPHQVFEMMNSIVYQYAI